MKNSEVAAVLEQLGELLEITGEEVFKVRAYQRAAQAIDGLREPVESAVKEDRLTDIPGVGEKIAEKVKDIIETGTCKLYDELKAKVPAGVVEMLQIPGLGPKKAGAFYRELGITSIEALEKAAAGGRIRDLPGMGKKTEENILEGIARIHARPDRLPIGDVRPYAEAMADVLRKAPGAEKVEVAGSLRRWRETVKDLDIVASSSDPAAMMKTFVGLPQVKEVIARGETKTSVLTDLGIQADLRVVTPGHFASLLNHFTGSKAHNVRLRHIANSRGLRINEYGVFKDPGDEAVPLGDDERALYDLLKMEYVIPEMREDTGEIELAQKRKLPDPVELRDFRCDLHCHTRSSDGANSLEEMAEAARARGYTHLGITDHSSSLIVAHGCTAEELREQIRAIKKWNDRNADSGFQLLAGTECDILGDGTLDWPEDLLKELDFVIASIHTRFKMEEKAMTARIVRALETGRVSILGHPTGRLVGSREPYAVDLPTVFEAAKRTGTCIEIDGHPERLDLSDSHARAARDSGLRIAVDSDAHSVDGLPLIEYGVHTARRAWLTAKDVINTYPIERLRRVFRREE